LAQDDRANAPWSNLEYRFAAQCLWEQQPAKAKEIADLAFGPATGKTHRIDGVACSDADGLKDRVWDAGTFGAELANARLRSAADCLLASRTAPSEEELRPLVDNLKAVGSNVQQFRLSPEMLKAAKRCDPIVSDWTNSGTGAALLIAAIAEQVDWLKKLEAWDADPAKQTESAKRAGCVWRNNANAARRFIITVGYGKALTKLERLQSLYGPTIASCIPEGATDASYPVQVFREIVDLAAYNPQGGH
jgi:hypothetical protein